jgi:hypothetical protein
MRLGTLLSCSALIVAGLSPVMAQDAPAAALSETERLKVQIARLLSQNETLQKDRAFWRVNFSQCVATLGKREGEEASAAASSYLAELVKEIEQAHPGYTLSPKGELVKKD